MDQVLSFVYYLGIAMACIYGTIAVWYIIWAPAWLFRWWWRTAIYPRFPHTNTWYHTARAISDGWHDGTPPPPPQTINVVVHPQDDPYGVLLDTLDRERWHRSPLPPPRRYRP